MAPSAAGRFLFRRLSLHPQARHFTTLCMTIAAVVWSGSPGSVRAGFLLDFGQLQGAEIKTLLAAIVLGTGVAEMRVEGVRGADESGEGVMVPVGFWGVATVSGPLEGH